MALPSGETPLPLSPGARIGDYERTLHDADTATLLVAGSQRAVEREGMPAGFDMEQCEAELFAHREELTSARIRSGSSSWIGA